MKRNTSGSSNKAGLLKHPNGPHGWGLMLLVMGVVAGVGYFVVKNGDAASCTVSNKLVNSCRPWLGASVDAYPDISSWQGQVLGHEARIGHQLDVVNQYNEASSIPLTSDETYFATRPSTILYINWKVADDWASAGGENAAINANIDAATKNIKALSPHKIMLSIWGEPENDVTGATSGCSALTGSAGTPAQYKAMWQNVEKRFKAKGVTNVVWVMDYAGASKSNCLATDLWPGNSLVDWVMYDPYGASNSSTWDNVVSPFYNFLTDHSDSTHAYTSKPWGLAAYGDGSRADQAHTYEFYDQAKASLDAGKYPRLKAYDIYDSLAPDNADYRVGYTAGGVYDAAELVHYKLFADDPIFTTSLPAPSPGDSPVSSSSP